MDKILRGLPFASTYIDDILVFSSDPVKHKEHLCQVFDHLQKAGLTLRGKKYHIGLSQVTYLGHVFSAKGMSPDLKKTQGVIEWPGFTDIAAVRQFIGLASYYRHYIANFAHHYVFMLLNCFIITSWANTLTCTQTTLYSNG